LPAAIHKRVTERAGHVRQGNRLAIFRPRQAVHRGWKIGDCGQTKSKRAEFYDFYLVESL